MKLGAIQQVSRPEPMQMRPLSQPRLQSLPASGKEDQDYLRLAFASVWQRWQRSKGRGKFVLESQC